MQVPTPATDLTGHNDSPERRLSPSAKVIGVLAALVGFYVSGSLLSPWPDLLSDEAASWGSRHSRLSFPAALRCARSSAVSVQSRGGPDYELRGASPRSFRRLRGRRGCAPAARPSAPEGQPQNDKMQQARHGWNGASLLILVLCGLTERRRDERPTGGIRPEVGAAIGSES